MALDDKRDDSPVSDLGGLENIGAWPPTHWDLLSLGLAPQLGAPQLDVSTVESAAHGLQPIVPVPAPTDASTARKGGETAHDRNPIDPTLPHRGPMPDMPYVPLVPVGGSTLGPRGHIAAAAPGAGPLGTEIPIANAMPGLAAVPAVPEAVPALAAPPGVPVVPGQTPAGQEVPQPTDQQAIDSKVSSYLGMPDEQLLRAKDTQDQARDQILRDHAAKTIADDEQQKIRNATTYQAGLARAQDAIIANDDAINKVASAPIEEHLSPMRTLAGVIGAFVGGLAAPFMGGKNAGLETYLHAIDQHIQTQKDEIANKTNALTLKGNHLHQLKQDLGSDYQAAEVLRAGVLEKGIREAESYAQNFDPRSTKAMRIALLVKGLRAQKAVSQQAANDHAVKQKLDEAEAQIKVETLQHTIRNDDQKLAIERWRASIEAEKAKNEKNKGATIYGPEELQRMNPGGPKVDTPMSLEDYTKVATLRGQGNEQAVSAPVVGSNGAVVPLTNKNGEQWSPGKEESVRYRKQVAAAIDYNRITNEMARIAAAHGGQSDYFKSPEWQQQKVKQQEAVAELHDAYGVTSFRESTAEYFEGMATAHIDPTSFVYNAQKALQTSNLDLQKRVNAQLKTAKYDGPPVQFTDLGTLPDSTPLVGRDTSVEKAKLAEPGIGGKIATKVFDPLNAGGDDQVRAENAAPSGPTGLDPTDDRNIVEQIRVARTSKNPEERNNAIERLADAATATVDQFEKGEAAKAISVLGRVRGEDPEVYKQVVAHLPEDQQETLKAYLDMPKLPDAARLTIPPQGKKR